MEILYTLGIDWKLLLAQVVNFGVLAAVLAYFVYKPILKLIDSRRDAVKKSMDDVERIGRQREEMEEFRKAEMQKIEKEANRLMEFAKADVAKAKDEMVAAAKKEADDALARGRQQLETEKQRIAADLSKSAAKLVVKLTGKILEKELSPADQDRLITQLEQSVSR